MKILLVAMLAVNAWGMNRSPHDIADQLIAAVQTATDNLKIFLERQDNALLEKYDPKNTSKNLSTIKEHSLEESLASSRNTIIDALNEFETTIQDMKKITLNRNVYLDQESPEKENLILENSRLVKSRVSIADSLDEMNKEESRKKLEEKLKELEKK